MSSIDYLRFNEINAVDFLSLLNGKKIRKHLIEHKQFTIKGVSNNLITPHQEYLALGNNAKARSASYIELFKTEIDDKLLGNIRKNINKGLALGNEVFIKEIEVLTNARVSSRKAGRPKKNVE